MKKLAKLWLGQNEDFLTSWAVSASQKGKQFLAISSFRN